MATLLLEIGHDVKKELNILLEEPDSKPDMALSSEKIGLNNPFRLFKVLS
jgi:hypothetical protein